MESLFSFVGIIIIVFGILQIILFFKIWGMTNDIKTVKNEFIRMLRYKDGKVLKESGVNEKLNIGDLVINIKSGKQMRIKCLKDGKYSCYSNGGTTFEADFEENEIKKF